MSQPVPTYNELMWPTVRALRELGDSGHISEISDAVVVLEDLTEEQQAESHTGRTSQTELDYRLGWARTHLKKIEMVENSIRGVWSLTELGQSVTEEDVVRAHGEWRAQERESRKATKQNATLQPVETETASGSESVDPSETTWQDDLIDRLRELAPDAFERLTQRLLREAGFRNVKVLGRSGDGGIDGVGVYQVSLISFPIYFQCKRYHGAVQAKDVRDFRGALAGRGEKGLLVTTGTFTKGAKDEASRDGAAPVDLVDGVELCELLKKYELGVRTRLVEESNLVPDFFDQF